MNPGKSLNWLDTRVSILPGKCNCKNGIFVALDTIQDYERKQNL